MEKIKKFFSNEIANIIFIIVFGIMILIILFILFFNYSFKLNGKSKIKIDYNTEYIDESAYVKFFNSKVKVDNKVNTKKIGIYKVSYTAKFLFINFKKTRIVEVVDKVPPIINLKGNSEVNICPLSNYQEEGYEAYDEYDGDLTKEVKIEEKDNYYIYSVVDKSGNETSTKRKINKIDIEKPNIELNGSSTIYLKVGMRYTEQGYIVSDNCDTNLSVKEESNLDTTTPGKYEINYKAVDTSGNEVVVTRNIIVYKEPGVGVIYLTFDDGPATGPTNKILSVLKEEGVKATFFVTGNGDGELIKQEYNEGHTVALHTNTHIYSYVYSSSDNYFEDLYAVQNRVYNLIGIRPNIIRFPGGSNNTVSNNYSYNIMETLRSQVIEKGFTYFDWNVSSNDAGGCFNSDCVYNNVINGLSKSRINVVLMHDIKPYTADAIKSIIEYGKNNGYEFYAITQDTYPIRFS